MVGEIPLVGRTLELERMVSQLARAEPAAFVLAGAAGVGKSRLAAEAEKAAIAIGHTTTHLVATRSASSIPFGAFAPLLRESEVPAGDLLGLLHRAGEVILEQAGPGQPLLLVVDDAHLLDEGSAALVHQLVLASSCSLVASVRTPAVSPDPVTALWKDGLADRIDLDALSEAEVEDFASHTLGGPVSGTSVRRLWDASGGNALYLRELLRGATESGALTDEGGVWMLRQTLSAPPRLVELVASRLVDLPQATLDVVNLLAVGEPLSLDLLEHLTSAAALEDADRRDLLSVSTKDPPYTACLIHPMYGDVLRQRLPRTHLRRLWATLAAGLQATGSERREDLLRVARWQLDAGVRSDAALFGRAAKWARQMFDLDLAARLARAAFDAGGGIEAGLVLGEAEYSAGRQQEAEEVLAALVPLCADDTELAQIANARAYNVGVLMGDRVGSEAIVDEALLAVSEPLARLQLLGRLAGIKLMAGEPLACLVGAAPLLESDDGSTLCRGAFLSSFALGLLGRTEEAVAVAQRGVERQREVDEIHIPESELVGAILGLAAAGHLAEAEAHAITAYRASVNANDLEGQASFCLLRGLVLVEQGLLSAAARSFREGAGINRQLQDLGALRWCLGGVALAEGMAGNTTAAQSAIADLSEVRPDWMIVFGPDLIDRGGAWAMAASGALSSARRLLGEAAVEARASQQWVAETRLLHDIARLGEPELVADRLGELSGVVEGDLVATRAAHAAALVSTSATRMGDVTARFEQHGARLLAAEAAATAAELYRAEGLRRHSSAFARKTIELRAACGNVRTPGFSTGAEVDRLTRRELEVAGLAAAGKSSREIAAVLYVSARTVDNHLQRIYSKLGVTSREELGESIGLG